MRRVVPLLVVLTFLATVPLSAAELNGNRLAYLDGVDPYYPGTTFPRLITPQWVGEDGVEAVVILSIDDMRGSERWEKFLRPVLNRLKRIDGRAPVSVMTCQVNPADPQLQTWLKEGLSLETHTADHPCPLLHGGDFDKAKGTYDCCVDLLHSVPNSKPVAFRTPCCDSLNTLSPRFLAEIFSKTTTKGNFLSIDSSVFNVITADDPELPREIVFDADGRDRFRKYLPRDRTFVNTIDNYCYPYVIGRTVWEFPCVTPSDWSAQHFHKPNNPTTVADWKAALDAVVIKKGVFTLVFHPHGWITPEQIIDLIDHAEARHGKKVKFLTFREALERLNKNLLNGHPIRDEKGDDNGARILDLDNDGFLDVVIGNDNIQQTRVWAPQTRSWLVGEFPAKVVKLDMGGSTRDLNVRFGVVRPDGHASFLVRSQAAKLAGGGWHFGDRGWEADPTLLAGLELDGKPLRTGLVGLDGGVRLLDLDRDGRCELVVSNPKQRAVFAWSPVKKAWEKLPFAPPGDTPLVDAQGVPRGLCFVDLDEDGRDDVIVSNETEYAVYLFADMEKGWSRKVMAGKTGDKGALPMVTRNGTNNGFWVHSRSLWWQNEDTNLLKDHVDRRSFNELLANVEPEPGRGFLRTRPGFKAEQVVAEPLVQDPIAFAFGPDGKLWVVEMGDYPLGTDGKGKGGGRVKFLTAGKDGKYTEMKGFLDGLAFPTSVMPWRKGVLITCAPDIIYAEDTDGDGKADKKEVLFTGFREGNQQHRVNGLVWGLDNWVYGANGDSGGKVKSLKTGVEVDISGADFRIMPDEGLIERVTGQTQYGRNRDDWGHWFGGNNANPMYQFVLEERYLKRNPHVVPPKSRVDVPAVPGAAPVFPVSRTMPRFNDFHTANHFTSACSPIVYRDDLFGPHFSNSTFVCEPVHNLVHREVLTRKGVLLTSRRAPDEETSEFLASADNWFRPTMVQTGPDGALWVCDMYRHVIEHPEWIPKDWQQRLDLRAGHTKGRIYRVIPVDKKPREIPRLDELDTAGLVAALDSPNGWQRDMAQMLLVQRLAKDALPALEKMAASRRPQARLHALCTLDGLGELTVPILKKALADDHPGVRRNAARLCEPLLEKSPELGDPLSRLGADADADVRLQAACSLGAWDDPLAGVALAEIALRDAADPYITAAVLSSLTLQNLGPMRVALFKQSGGAPPARLVESLARTAEGLGDTKSLVQILKVIGEPADGKFASWQLLSLAGMLDGLDQRGSSLATLAKKDELQAAVKGLSGLFSTARKTVADEKASAQDRLLAVRLLGRGLDGAAEDRKTLAEFLTPRHPEELQSAAAATLGRDPRAADLMLSGWKGYSPALRSQLLEVLLRREEGVKAVLDAAEKRQVEPFEIDAARRQQLLQHKDAALRDRAVKLFRDSISADRQKVLDKYRETLTLSGDATRGAELFVKHCAACHKLGNVGQVVGPDLASLGDKSAEGMLIAVLDPNRAVEARYVNYLATLKNGQTFSGVLTSQSATSITLVSSAGKEQVLLRADLDELVSSGKSVMPEGLEKDLSPQALADLIAHVRSGVRPPERKTFEGNTPEVAKPGGDGSLLLTAKASEIYGGTLVLEKQYGNLGWWSSEDDHAVWTVEAAKAGQYEVWLDYACEDKSSGNRWVMTAGTERLTGVVAGTGNWDTYKLVKVGELTLTAGRQRVLLRSLGPVKGAMIDLKAVKLVPLGR